MESLLRLLRHCCNPHGLIRQDAPHAGAKSGPMAVTPRGFDEDPAYVTVAPTEPIAHAYLSWAFHAQGMYAEALRETQKAFDLSKNPWHLAGVARQLVHVGRIAEAEAMLKDVKPQASNTNAATGIAMYYAALGQREEALAWLERAYEAHTFGMLTVHMQPDFDSLHAEPRFQAIVRGMRLPSRN